MNDFLRWLRVALLGAPAPPVLEEERFPCDAMGRPDLTRFTRPLDHYVGYVEAYLTSLDPQAPAATGVEPWRHNSAWQSHAYRKGVLGQWGLIARGPAEALPYVLGLLQHRIREGRSAGAGVLEAWTDAMTHKDLAAHALAAAEREAAQAEPDPETLGVLLGFLGRLEVTEALPLLAKVLRAPESRVGDLDWAAAESVASIAGDSFDKAGELRDAAERWLRGRGL